MPTTAYAVTVTPPEISGFYAPVEVRFEHAAAPAAEPNPNPAYLVRDGSTALQGRQLISDATTFYFPAATAVLLTTWANGDDASKQSVTPAAYATPTAVTLQPSSSGTPGTSLSSRFTPHIRFARNFDGASTDAKVTAAIADLGSDPGLVIISPDDATGSITIPPDNITIVDFRGGSPTYGLGINGQTAGVHHGMRYHQDVTDPDRSFVSFYGVTDVRGTITESTSQIGAEGAVRLMGTLDASTSSAVVLIGVEASAQVFSTGETLSQLRGATLNAATRTGSTTNVTDAAAAVAQSVTKEGTGTIANAYGLVAEHQSVGSTRNYAIYSQGHLLLSNNRNVDGITAGGTVKRFITLSSGDLIVFRPLADAQGFSFRDESNTEVLGITSTAINLATPPTIASDTRWYDAMSFREGTGSPAYANPSSRTTGWAMDAASTENVRGQVFIPPKWNTMKVDVYWTNGGAGSGDVRWQVAGGILANADAISDEIAATEAVGTAAVADTTVVTTVITSAAVTGGAPYHMRVQRQASAGTDTLANDATFIGVLLTRLT